MRKILITFLIAASLITVFGVVTPLHAETKEQAVARAQAGRDQAAVALKEAQAKFDNVSGALSTCYGAYGLPNIREILGFCENEYAAKSTAEANLAQAQHSLEAAEKDLRFTQSLPEGDRATDAANAAQREGSNGARAASGTQNKGISQFTPSCSIDANFSIGECLKQGLAWMAYFGMYTTSWLVGISGLLLNQAIRFSVIEMRSWVEKLQAVNYGWTLARDVGNLAFIFILIYVAIKTILGLEGTDTKRLIRNLIIVGLLVNFSLFFTKVLIDASNIVSLGFYNGIIGDGTIQGFSEKFAAPLGIQKLYDPDPQAFIASMTQNSNSWATIMITGLGGTIFLFIVALAFLYAAFLFIIRFVVLIVLMILSPFAYFGFILPATSGMAKKWWGALTGQLIFAPLYMMLFYLVVIFSENLNKLMSNDLVASLIPDPAKLAETDSITASIGASPMEAAIKFFIIIGFMLASTVIATIAASSSGGLIGSVVKTGSFKLNSFGRGVLRKSKDTAVGGGRMAGAAAGKATFGVAAYGMRNTIGKSAYKTANSDQLKDTAALGGVKGAIASAKLAVANKVSKSSFDVRATGITGKAMGTAGGKGGFSGYVDATKKKATDRVKALGTGDMFKMNGQYVSGAQKMAEARAAALIALKAGGQPFDQLDVNNKAKEKYGEITKQMVANGYTKQTRKVVYAESVLRQGNLAQRIYSNPLRAAARVASFGLVGANTTAYQNTYVGHMEAAKEVLKAAKKEKDKSQLGSLEAQRRSMERELIDIENRFRAQQTKVDGTSDPAEKAREEAVLKDFRAKENELNDKIDSKVRDINEAKKSEKSDTGGGDAGSQPRPATT